MLIYFLTLHTSKQLPKSEVATKWTGYQNDFHNMIFSGLLKKERPKEKVSFRTIPSSEQVPIPTILQ